MRKALKREANKMARIGQGMSVSKEKERKMRKKPGGSNVGEYKGVSKGDFAGPSGGAPKGTYPINTKKRARSALAYAHNAPNPEGIREAVHRKWPDLGKNDED